MLFLRLEDVVRARPGQGEHQPRHRYTTEPVPAHLPDATPRPLLAAGFSAHGDTADSRSKAG
jgi:hypothetical protein